MKKEDTSEEIRGRAREGESGDKSQEPFLFPILSRGVYYLRHAFSLIRENILLQKTLPTFLTFKPCLQPTKARHGVMWC